MDFLHAGQDGTPPRLRGVSRQHWLYPQGGQRGRQMFRGFPGPLEPTKRLGPGTRLMLRSVDRLI